MDRFPLPASAAYGYQQNFTLEHLGIDIMAPKGTPVVAVESGLAWATTEPKGGNVVYLDGASGVRYFYGHLDRWGAKVLIMDRPSSDVKVRVNAGDELGFVGNTGNAAGRPTHLHFQMRDGSLVMDPYPELQKVDPHRERGRSGTTVHQKERASSSVIPTGVLLLALLWLATRGR